MQFAIGHHQTSSLVEEVYRKLPAKERKLVERRIVAITDSDLVTTVRPFMFGGKVVRELYFDPAKLLFFTVIEKIGAIISAFIIASLAQNAGVPLSDQSLRTHAKQIVQFGNRLKYGSEVSAFLRRVGTLEDEWRRDSFSDLPDEPSC